MKWYEAPELVPQHSLPEVYYPPSVLVASYHRANLAPTSHDSSNSPNGTVMSADVPEDTYFGTTSIQSHEDQSTVGALPPAEQPVKPQRRVCGCSLLVLVLSTIIALLSIAVIGLAAGTSIQTDRVNDAKSKLASYLVDIDRGCSANPDSVTATRYTSDCKSRYSQIFKVATRETTNSSVVFDRSTYNIFCNSDAPNPPLQSLFVSNFNDCMDACASYSSYTAGNFPDDPISKNFTCAAASFIPDWTNRTNALAVNAPGNCYLKPGPQSSTTLTHPNTDGPAVHAALLADS